MSEVEERFEPATFAIVDVGKCHILATTDYGTVMKPFTVKLQFILMYKLIQIKKNYLIEIYFCLNNILFTNVLFTKYIIYLILNYIGECT